MYIYDLCIPSHGWVHPVLELVQSLHHQTMLPARVIILVWKERTVAELHEFVTSLHEVLDPLGIDLIIQHTHYSDHQPGRGVGYDRHFLIQQAQHEWSCMIDEDNILPPGQLDAWILGYQQVVKELGHEAIVSPTVMRAGEIQSQWITWFSYLFPQYTFGRCGDKKWQEVLMMGANSFFGRTEVFQHIQFDPAFVGSYEDIDFTSRVRLSGTSVVVLWDVYIDHQESPKTFLWWLFLGTPEHAYRRSKNRILRVKKTATKRQKVQYFGCGLWVQTAGWMRYICRSEVRKKWALFGAIMRWIRDGIRESTK